MHTVGGLHVAVVTVRWGYELMGPVHKANGERFVPVHKIHTRCNRYLNADHCAFTSDEVTCKQCLAKERS